MTSIDGNTWRVSLTPLQPCERPAQIPWLAEAWSAIDGVKPDATAPTTAASLLEAATRRWPNACVERIDLVSHGFGGFVAWESVGEEVLIRGLAVRRDRRNLGYGGEAVERLEATWPDRHFAAAIPRFNGLAIYFWLRVGFRPIRVDEDRGRAWDPAHLWMVRSVASDVSDAMSDP